MKPDEEGKDHQNVEVATENAERPNTQLKLKIKTPLASTDGQKNKSDGERKDHENFEAFIDKKGPTECDSDSGSVRIIDFSSHFSPYQSHMDRELSKELLDMKKKKKRSVALANWDWDSVVDLGSSQDEESESELSDTADSAKPAKKVPRITIHRRNRVLKLIDESSEDDEWLVCRKKVTVRDGRHFCVKCQKTFDNLRETYKLDLELFHNNEQMTCVIFNETAIALIGLTVDALVMKSLTEGADDPHWIHNFLLDNLCAEQVVFTIKIDKFNIAPHYARHFTVTKYHKDVKIDNPNTTQYTHSSVEVSSVTEDNSQSVNTSSNDTTEVTLHEDGCTEVEGDDASNICISENVCVAIEEVPSVKVMQDANQDVCVAMEDVASIKGMLDVKEVEPNQDESISCVETSSNDALSDKSIHEDSCHTTEFHVDDTSMIDVQDEDQNDQSEIAGNSDIEAYCDSKKDEVSASSTP